MSNRKTDRDAILGLRAQYKNEYESGKTHESYVTWLEERIAAGADYDFHIVLKQCPPPWHVHGEWKVVVDANGRVVLNGDISDLRDNAALNRMIVRMANAFFYENGY